MSIETEQKADNESIVQLARVFKALGIDSTKDIKYEILTYSKPDYEENRAFYKKTNERFSALLESRRIENFVHVTGEMSAIINPEHYEVCTKYCKKEKKSFRIYSYLKRDIERTPQNIIRSDAPIWNESWRNIMSAFDLLAAGWALLRVSPSFPEIHYTQFGENLVILQGIHAHGEEKFLWFISSGDLMEILDARTLEIDKKSELISPSLFYDFASSISSGISLQTLFTISEAGKPVMKKKLKGNTLPHQDFMNVYENLKCIGFLYENADFVEITDSGKEFLTLFV